MSDSTKPIRIDDVSLFGVTTVRATKTVSYSEMLTYQGDLDESINAELNKQLEECLSSLFVTAYTIPLSNSQSPGGKKVTREIKVITDYQKFLDNLQNILNDNYKRGAQKVHDEILKNLKEEGLL